MNTGFKKKSEFHQTVSEFEDNLSMLLSLGSAKEKGILNRELIIGCASFWDSKQRIDKIKSLILKNHELQAFEDGEDFQVEELMSIQLLSLSHNHITYLQPLKSLDTLVCLNVNRNKIYDISPLSQLTKLQQFYAAHNQITNIDALSPLHSLRIINLYANQISRLQETIQILLKLYNLEELDIENNPIYNQEARKHFLALSIMRLNGDLIMSSEKENQIAMSNSCIIKPINFSNSGSSFFNKTAKSQLTSYTSKLEELQANYATVDDKFEEEITKNVQLKAKYHQAMSKKRKEDELKELHEERFNEIQDLKRKVKSLKQNLFTKDEKGELLRAIFEVQMGKYAKQTQSEVGRVAVVPVWSRRFDFDEEITIESKQFLDEDDQIEMMLSNNSSSIQQLKRELRNIRND